jgi:hypothetical protein
VHWKNPVCNIQMMPVANVVIHGGGAGEGEDDKEFLDCANELADIIVKNQVRLLAGDFGNKLFQLAAQIRRCGVKLQVIAWRPMVEDGWHSVDSCAMFYIGRYNDVKLCHTSFSHAGSGMVRSPMSRYIWDYTYGDGGGGAVDVDAIFDNTHGHGDGFTTQYRTSQWRMLPTWKEKSGNAIGLPPKAIPLLGFMGMKSRRGPEQQAVRKMKKARFLSRRSAYDQQGTPRSTPDTPIYPPTPWWYDPSSWWLWQTQHAACPPR